MGNRDTHTPNRDIPPYPLNRGEISSKCPQYCIYYSVETKEELTQSLMGIFHCNILGDFGIGNYPTDSLVSDNPPILKGEL